MKNEIISLIKASINGSVATIDGVPDWRKIYTIAAQHGVLALVFDAVATLPSEQQPPKSLKMQWIASMANIEQRYNYQRSVAKDLAEQFYKMA